MRFELNRLREDFTMKFEELFKRVNIKEEIKRPEERKFERKEPQQEKPKHNQFQMVLDSSDDEYSCDEFESDYSFGFRNI